MEELVEGVTTPLLVAVVLIVEVHCARDEAVCTIRCVYYKLSDYITCIVSSSLQYIVSSALLTLSLFPILLLFFFLLEFVDSN